MRGTRLLAASALALGLWPASAVADTVLGTENGFTYVSDSETALSGQPSAPLAECPAGTKVIGGGGDALTSSLEGILASAAPGDGPDQDAKPDDFFRVFTHNTTASSSTADVWAICAPGKTRYERASVNVGVGKAKSQKAKCPGGTKVVGGGVYLTGSNSEIFINATRPWDSRDRGKKPDDGWFVRAANVAGSRKVMTAHAMCRMDVSINPFGGFGGTSPGSGGVGGACESDNDSLTGPGGEIQGTDPTLLRLSAVRPSDNTIEAGTVPDDAVAVEAENLTASSSPLGAFGICGT
jgi:hypothetical protein